jgi:hypothetical protein
LVFYIGAADYNRKPDIAMAGEIYERLKAYFTANIAPDAEQMIFGLTYNNQLKDYSAFIDKHRLEREDFNDRISSLLLLRSLDVVYTQEAMASASGYGPIGVKIKPSDVLLSIYTMPCMPPIFIDCIENITSGDLRFVTVFSKDEEFLRVVGISDIFILKRYMITNRSDILEFLDDLSLSVAKSDHTTFNIQNACLEYQL